MNATYLVMIVDNQSIQQNNSTQLRGLQDLLLEMQVMAIARNAWNQPGGGIIIGVWLQGTKLRSTTQCLNAHKKTLLCKELTVRAWIGIRLRCFDGLIIAYGVRMGGGDGPPIDTTKVSCERGFVFSV